MGAAYMFAVCFIFISGYLVLAEIIVVTCIMGSDYKDSVKTQYLPMYIFYVFSVSFHVLYGN